MKDGLKLMCVLAHPDDESLGTGGVIAKYAQEGVDVYLITATLGEHGWPGNPETHPGPEVLGQMRQEELHAAARILGVREGAFLGYVDGQVNKVDPAEAIAKISMHIRRLRPHVIITFDPFGVYGHPDHIAISQFTHAAVVQAASGNEIHDDGYEPHLVSKFYYMAETQENLDQYQEVLGELVFEVDGQKRQTRGWEHWAITTHIDVSKYRELVKKAVECHRTQFPDQEKIEGLFEQKVNLWTVATLYRVFSLTDQNRKVEDDLFDGLR
jgi:LmbE family N-acetylglucosaminyl deacetylase